jgi:serine/threonine protein kinase
MAEPTTSHEAPGSTAHDARSRSDTQESLGQYLLLEKLGEGGMGAVYKGMHSKLKKLFAVKILTPRREFFADMVERFHLEMEAVGRLDHPNIVRATDAGEDSGRFFLVMDYFEGSDLAKVLAARGPLPVAEACGVIYQAACGLQYIADRGLVHRDIKPSNLLLTSEGKVKILDLGLALLRRQEAAEELTEVGQVMGTYDYMAPEQTRDSHQVDIRADIYSLGCTFYKLLTGQPPFPGSMYRTSREKVLAHREATAVPLSVYRQDVPEALTIVLARMLAKTPEERQQAPREVAEALEAYVQNPDLSALLPAPQAGRGPALPGSTEKEPWREAATAGKKRQPWYVAVGSLLVGLTLSGLIVYGFFQMAGGSRDRPGRDSAGKDEDVELSPDKWEFGKWYSLMRRPPTHIHWAKDWTPPVWNKGRAEIISVPGEIGLLGLLEPPAKSSYRFKIKINQNPWTGGVGVFFGYQKTSDGTKTIIRYQSIVLHKVEPNELWVERRKNTWRIMEDGKKILPPARVAGKALVMPPRGDEASLEIEVHGSFLARVNWAGQELPGLCDAKANAQFAPEDYAGALGVFNIRNHVVFRDAELMFLER